MLTNEVSSENVIFEAGYHNNDELCLQIEVTKILFQP